MTYREAMIALKRAAKAYPGVTVENDGSPRGDVLINIAAPDGMLWADGSCKHLVVNWYAPRRP